MFAAAPVCDGDLPCALYACAWLTKQVAVHLVVVGRYSRATTQTV
jgi:hypothetical protein